VQGYGFVKFTEKDVAKIAAEAMNGYLMNGKKLSVNVLSDEHPDPFKYKHGSSKLFFVNWAERFVQE
jgi:nucleolar protein 15